MWLEWIFLGEYFPSLSINYVDMSKDMGKRLPQLYYRKMKISYDLGLLHSESPWQRNDAIMFFYLSLCFSVPGVFWRNRLREYVAAISASILKKFEQILWERFRIFWNAVLTIKNVEYTQDEKSSIRKLKHGGNRWLRCGNAAAKACFR